MTVGGRIAALREQRGWSRGELARRMGTTPQQLERLEKGQRRLTEDWMSRAAAALEVAVGALVEGVAHDTPVEPQTNAVPFKYQVESGHRVAENLPIYGTALGAGRIVDGESIEQTMLNTGDVVGYLKRPVLLNGRNDVYGLYVHGTSMDPVFCEGATIVAEMKRPARIGDDVVVYLRPLDDNDDGISARSVLVKRLVRRSATFVELQQFNPAVTFRIDVVEIVRIDRVMTLGDLLS